MTETGLLKKFDGKYKLKDICEEKRREMQKTHPITAGEIMALFVLLGAGLSAAFVVFFFEFMLHWI